MNFLHKIAVRISDQLYELTDESTIGGILDEIENETKNQTNRNNIQKRDNQPKTDYGSLGETCVNNVKLIAKSSNTINENVC